MRGDNDKATGVADKVKGKVEKATGDLTGNNDMKAKGNRDEMKGSAKKGLGNVKNAADDLTS
jgi:uncharacterized protein YjbJ (UPF0337 family)